MFKLNYVESPIYAMRLSLCFFAFVLLLSGNQVAYAQSPVTKDSFPRIGGINIAPRNYEDPAYQAKLAKADWVIFGFYENWSKNGQSMADVISNIKAINPDLVAANYTNPSAVRDDGSAMAEKIGSSKGPNGIGDWWGYDANGVRLRWTSDAYHVNYTTLVTPDSNGDRWPQWLAKYDKATFYDNAGFDMVFIDNMSSKDWTGTGTPDYDRDGRPDSSGARDAQYRAAHAAYIDKFRALMPNHAVIGNITPWLIPGFTDDVYPEYKGKLDGGVMERVIGADYSIEGSDADGSLNSWGSWEKMMGAYQNAVNWTSGQFIMFSVSGYADDYQTMRYGLTSCLMGNGYYSYSDQLQLFHSLPWFDEFDVDLGKSMSPHQISPWKNGVYRRDFEKGVVLVNPRRNGRQVVNVGSGLRRLNGTQDPSHNNGQAVESLVLNDGDGIILIRENVVTRPKPPTISSNSN